MVLAVSIARDALLPSRLEAADAQRIACRVLVNGSASIVTSPRRRL
jgi:hypothetical protein